MQKALAANIYKHQDAHDIAIQRVQHLKKDIVESDKGLFYVDSNDFDNSNNWSKVEFTDNINEIIQTETVYTSISYYNDFMCCSSWFTKRY